MQTIMSRLNQDEIVLHDPSHGEERSQPGSNATTRTGDKHLSFQGPRHIYMSHEGHPQFLPATGNWELQDRDANNNLGRIKRNGMFGPLGIKDGNLPQVFGRCLIRSLHGVI